MAQWSPKTGIERIRVEAVHRVLCGESPEKVIADYGFARSCIYEWLKRHRQGGDDALVSHQSPGRPPCLTNDDRRRLFESLLRSPRTLGAWTITDLLHLIKNGLGVEPSRVTAWRILKSLGIVPVGTRSPGKTIWWQAHRDKISTQLYFVSERDTIVFSELGGVTKGYVLLVASTPRNQVLFQLYAEAPSKETFERFIYKLTPQSDISTTLVLSSRSPRYRQAINLAIAMSLDKNANLPPEATSHEQVVGEERDGLSSKKRYRQPLVVYRLD